MMKDMTNIAGAQRKILDHGFVRVVDTMGNDEAVVQAARVSYGKGTKKTSEDRGLIRYLMRQRHTSPFEMCEIKLHVRLPIFVARQWIRHRTANVNEVSGRYSELPKEFYVPELHRVMEQSTTNKQGSGEEMPEQVQNDFRVGSQYHASDDFDFYEKFLEKGVTREIARINLPVSTYTEWYWKVDVHNLLHFLKLRTDPHAQWEIREYANAIAEMFQQWMPLTYEAFEDYVLNAVTFSAAEQKALGSIIVGGSPVGAMADWFLQGREKDDFLKKLSLITSRNQSEKE